VKDFRQHLAADDQKEEEEDDEKKKMLRGEMVIPDDATHLFGA
jgi:hypothetical protein